jgi:hypothetical protein
MALWETYEVALCGDCIYMDANGWDEHETGEPLPVPTPLSLLPRGVLIGVKACGDGDGCECRYDPHFASTPCRGCGNSLAGDRYDCEVSVPIKG